MPEDTNIGGNFRHFRMLLREILFSIRNYISEMEGSLFGTE